jgi:hypothetical protein
MNFPPSRSPTKAAGPDWRRMNGGLEATGLRPCRVLRSAAALAVLPFAALRARPAHIVLLRSVGIGHPRQCAPQDAGTSPHGATRRPHGRLRSNEAPSHSNPSSIAGKPTSLTTPIAGEFGRGSSGPNLNGGCPPS